MVKIKYVIMAVLVVGIGIFAGLRLFESEEKKVKKQIDLLAKWVSKEANEKILTTASKIDKIHTLFAEDCEFKVPIASLSGRYTPEEISSYAARGRSQFSKLSLKFHDLDIDLTEKGVAKVNLTARLTGESAIGEHVDEIRELGCILKKIEKKWIFTNFEVVEVLKK